MRDYKNFNNLIQFTNSQNYQDIKSPKIINGEIIEMKNINLRNDGRWQYTKMINGIRTYIYAKTKEKLREKLKALKPPKQVKSKKITLGEWAIEWYHTYKEQNIKEKTKQEYNNTIYNHINKQYCNTYFNKLTTLQIQKFLNSIKGERIREKVFQHLVNILKSAKAHNLIKEDLTIGLIKPVQKNKKTKYPLTIKQQKRFLKTIKNTEIEKFCLFSLILGTRRAETLKFKISDINKKNNTLKIHGTKTKNANRIIKISNAMINYLCKDIQNKNKKVFNWNGKTIYNKVKNIFKKLKMPEMSIHSLRHTCATNLYYLGIRDKHRQHQLGHSSIVVTNDIYTHIELEIKREDIIKLYENLYYEF